MSKQPARATPARDRHQSPGPSGQGPARQGDKKSGVRQKTAVDPSRAGAMSRAAPLFTLARPVQTKTVIGEANDRYEQEADAVANRISSGRPAPSVSRLGAAVPAGLAQRAGAEEEAEEALVQTKRVQRRTIAGPSENGMAKTADQVTRNPPVGTPLPPAMRHKLETGLDTDLSGVRVHQGDSAETAAQQLQARAFTHQNHIWLGAGESVHDVGLMAHEATHVVQQGAAPAPQTTTISRAPARVQRLPRIIGEFLNDYAQDIPGYNLFTVIIGYNPLLGQRVERTAINLVQGLLGLLGPIGNYIFAKLQELNILQPAFTWVSDQLKRLDLSLSRLERTVEAAYDEMRLRYGFQRNLEIARRHFGRLYNDVVTFVQALVNQILAMIKEAAIGVAEGLLAENRAWALTKKVIRYDPLRGEDVEASTVEILEDFLLLIGKETELAQMRERETLQETADWLDTQWAVFSGLLGQLRSLIAAAWDAIQPENLPNLMSNLRTLAGQAFGFIQQVWGFATTVALKVFELIKKALLGWLSDVVHELPGFHLLTVILGRNPFTQVAVPRTPENIIRGFITLLPGGNAQYQQLEETGTIGQTAARIEGAMNELGISWPFIVGLFTDIWDSLSIQDLVQPVAAFQRIREQFGEPVFRLFAFVRVVITEIFKLVLEMMNFPSDLIGSIISNAMAAFESIRSNPVGFLLNMLAAVKLGFSNFFGNILQYLVGGLVDWLFRGLRQAGIQPPTDLSLASILDLVLQILGLTTDRIWQKVAERIGQENVDRIRGAMDRLVGIWTFIRDVQERGVAAIWEYIQSQISGLWDMVLEQARNWIMERIVNRAIQWLLSLLDPTGIMPVINSFIAFFNAIQSAIEYMRDILAIINDYVSTLAAVARGALAAGAQKLEQGLANAIPIGIGFLANQFGLGNIGEKMAEIVGGIRSLIDRALDWLMDQAERAWQGLMGMLGFGDEEGSAEESVPEDIAWWEDQEPIVDAVGASHTLLFSGSGSSSILVVRSEEQVVNNWLIAQRNLAPEATRPLFDQALQAYDSFVQARDALESQRVAYEAMSAENQAAQRPTLQTAYQMYRSTLRTLGRSFNVLPLGGEPERIELILPPQKNARLYRGYLSSGLLQHSLDRPERSTNQIAIWEADIRREMSPESLDLGRQLDLTDSQILRPDWNKNGQRMSMQVDHKVEWQVRPIGDETLLDDPSNMELLDARANQASGQAIHSTIQNLRQTLAEQTGDQSWLFRDLTFTHVSGGGSAGDRWFDEEIKRGEHLEIYRTLLAENPYTESVPSAAEVLEQRSVETSSPAQTMERRGSVESTIRSLENRYPTDAANIRRFVVYRLNGSSYDTIRSSLGLTAGELAFIRSVVEEAGMRF